MKSSLGQAHLISLVAWSKGKTHGRRYHMGTYVHSVANIFEVEQHLTKWTLDFNSPSKRKLPTQLKIGNFNILPRCKACANISVVTF